MEINNFKKKWVDFVNRMNKYGIAVPTARDPQTGKGSLTASLLVFSAGLFGLCIVFLLAGAVAKWAGIFVLNDITIAQIKTAADYSFQFLLAALGGYLGRKMQKGSQFLEGSNDQSNQNSLPNQKIDNPDA